MNKNLLLRVLTLSLSATIFFSPTNADFIRDKLYCTLTEEGIRIHLITQESSFLCKNYLQLLNTTLYKEYQNLLQIINNKLRGDDLEYRNTLYETKKTYFLKLFQQSKDIETAIQNFQTTLLEKSQLFLKPILQEKKSSLITIKEDLENQISIKINTSKAEQQLAKIILQLKLITTLESTQDLDNFLKTLNEYIALSNT